MAFKNLCVLVLWMKVASTMEGFIFNIFDKYKMLISLVYINVISVLDGNQFDSVTDLVLHPETK